MLSSVRRGAPARAAPHDCLSPDPGKVSFEGRGLERDDATLLPTSYYEKLPPVEGRHVLLLDPMLATGGSAAGACARISERGPAEIRFVCVVAAPQGAEKMSREHPDVPVFTAALDRDLNDKGYILPGLGDFGDRLFGTGPDSGLPRPVKGSARRPAG